MTITRDSLHQFVASPQPRITRRGVLKGALGATAALGAAGAGTVGVAAGIAAFDLRVTTYKLSPPAWRAGQKLTITAIADLHAGGPNVTLDRVAQVVDTANALNSDLVVLLGDYFSTQRLRTSVVPHSAWAGQLARLKAPLGVFAIYGNHDWWHGIRAVRQALGRVQIPALENDVVRLGEGSQRFWLAGLGDQIAHRLGGGRFRGVDDLPGTLDRVRGDDPVLLLAHEPDIFVNVPDRVALTLAGHTHGGQVRVPFLWQRWVPSAYGARFAYGHIAENNRHMIVSGGIGTSIVPLRLGVPPEIVRVELG